MHREKNMQPNPIEYTKVSGQEGEGEQIKETKKVYPLSLVE